VIDLQFGVRIVLFSFSRLVQLGQTNSVGAFIYSKVLLGVALLCVAYVTVIAPCTPIAG
jgi:hypothetical protein